MSCRLTTKLCFERKIGRLAHLRNLFIWTLKPLAVCIKPSSVCGVLGGSLSQWPCACVCECAVCPCEVLHGSSQRHFAKKVLSLTFCPLISFLALTISNSKRWEGRVWGFFPSEFDCWSLINDSGNLIFIMDERWNLFPVCFPTKSLPVLILLCCSEDSESPRHFIPTDYLESTEEFIRRRHDDKEVNAIFKIS